MPIRNKSTQALILWSHLFPQVLPRKNQPIVDSLLFQVHVAWCCSAHTHAPFVVLRAFKELIFFFPQEISDILPFWSFQATCLHIQKLENMWLEADTFVYCRFEDNEFIRTLSSAFHTWTAMFSEVSEKLSKFLALLPIPTGPEGMNRRFYLLFF